MSRVERGDGDRCQLHSTYSNAWRWLAEVGVFLFMTSATLTEFLRTIMCRILVKLRKESLMSDLSNLIKAIVKSQNFSLCSRSLLVIKKLPSPTQDEVRFKFRCRRVRFH